MDLSVVIVNYNVAYFLDQCLKSVFRSGKGIAMEVIVVDNNSVDNSLEMLQKNYPEVRVIANPKNVGFSKGCNQGIEVSQGRHVLLLNPDTVVEDQTFEQVVRFMDDHPDAGGLGVKMLDGQGRFLPESKRSLPTPAVAFYKIFGLSRLFPRSRTFNRYHLGYLDPDQIHEVEVLAGAFMLLRREALDKTGCLDESFFMFGEDIDLSYRLIKAGYKNYYFPKTRIIHYKGESTKKASLNYVYMFYSAMVIFASKHFTKKRAKVFSLVINSAIFLRASLAIMNRFIKKAIWPLTDALVIFAGFAFIKAAWEDFRFGPAHYPEEFLLFVVPFYIFVWLVAVYFSGGYDEPSKVYRILRGIFIGTAIILVVYALLPTNLRFSRALILLGAIWVVFSMLFTRSISRLFGIEKAHHESNRKKRIIIVGDGTEADRILQMIRQSGNTAFMGLVSTRDQKPDTEGYVGTLQQIDEIISIYRIGEVIFCAANMSSQDIIDQMAALNNRKVGFKIAPPESLYIIGSNTIDTFGDIYAININPVSSPANRRNKRLFDLLSSAFLLLALPVMLFLVYKPYGLVKNILRVISGSRTWVGYYPCEGSAKLPKLKKGVLFPGDPFQKKVIDLDTLCNLNNLYAREYHIENDFNILLRSFRNLGRN
ncbi:MAG TPA: glycosyltransferase [Bacteroidales bacterium]|nr:glycosyltransferase [Bacteroidales bacterium]